jgi:cysteine desulfurase
MRPYWSEKFGNPSSLHRAGAGALEALDRARENIARLVGVEFRSVVFTASATEANNLALRGVVRAFTLGNQNSFLPRIIVSAVEHDSVLETARDMERAGEAELVILPVDKRGVVDIKKLERALDERTALVSVMYVNNEIGTVQPLAEISNLIRRFRDEQNSAKAKPNFPVKGKTWASPRRHPEQGNRVSTPYPLFHTDAAQAFLYVPCDVRELGADLMTLSSQKIYGPKGAGALIGPMSPMGPISPIITGGGQEFGLRAGTENVPNIAGFAAAAVYAEQERKKNSDHAHRVRDAFVEALKKAIPSVEENGPAGLPADRQAPHIANIAFPSGVSSEDLLVLFDREGIAANPGAACSARALRLSHVLRAIGLSDERIRRSIRFSFGRGVTLAGAKGAAQKIVGISRYILEKKS